MDWKKITNDNPLISFRYGHSAILFQKKLLLFGGKIRSNNYIFCADLEIFNLEDKQWSNPIVYTKSTLKLRAHHAAEIIGRNNRIIYNNMHVGILLDTLILKYIRS